MKKQFLFIILLAISSACSQAHVGFSFGFGGPHGGFGISTMAPAPCYAPVVMHPCHHVVPAIAFSVHIPVARKPWRITNETSDFIEVMTRNQATIIKPGRTKRIARTGNKLTIFAACNGEEVTLRPECRTFSIGENRQGDLVYLA